MDEQSDKEELERAEKRLEEACRRQARLRDHNASRQTRHAVAGWIGAGFVVSAGIMNVMNPRHGPIMRLLWFVLLPIAFTAFIYYATGFLGVSRRGRSLEPAEESESTSGVPQNLALRLVLLSIFVVMQVLLVGFVCSRARHRSEAVNRAVAQSLSPRRSVTYTRNGISTSVAEIAATFLSRIPNDPQWQKKLLAPLDRRDLERLDFAFTRDLLAAETVGNVSVEDGGVTVLVENRTSNFRFRLRQKRIE